MYTFFLLRPGRRAECCDQFVCLSVCLSVCLCLSASISLEPLEWLDRSSRKFVCGSPVTVALSSSDGVANLRYVMYFRFMDDVTFGRNGPYDDAWLQFVFNATKN